MTLTNADMSLKAVRFKANGVPFRISGTSANGGIFVRQAMDLIINEKTGKSKQILREEIHKWGRTIKMEIELLPNPKLI